ncbi:hypothetical protein ABZP36_000222 [Zizania latifolia]
MYFICYVCYWMNMKNICQSTSFQREYSNNVFYSFNRHSYNLFLYRNITPEEKYGQLFVFSLKLALWMQIIGFSVRFLSSFIWIQMYRLGVSSSTPTYHEANYDGRNSFLSPRSNSVRRNSMADDILGGSIYDPAYYSSLFEDVRNNTCNHQGDKQSGGNDSGSTSAGQSPRLKSFASRSFLANDVSHA